MCSRFVTIVVVAEVTTTEENLKASRIKTNEKETLQSVCRKRTPPTPLLSLQA